MKPASARFPVSSISRARPTRSSISAHSAPVRWSFQRIAGRSTASSAPSATRPCIWPEKPSGSPSFQPSSASAAPARLPPVLGVLLGPARLRRRERVLALDAGEHLAGRRDRDRLDAGRADVQPGEPRLAQSVDGFARLGRAVERLDHPRLRERVLPPEQRLRLAGDRGGEVHELERVRVGRGHVDLLAVEKHPAAQVRPPRRLEHERPVLADRLHALPVRQRERGVELRDDVAGEAERSVEVDVDARRADHLLAVHVLGLAAEQPRAADAVAADVHQRAAVEVGDHPDVAQVAQREAERRADVAEPADRAVLDERPRDRRLRVVAPHEGLHHDDAGARRRRPTPPRPRPTGASRASRRGRACRPRSPSSSTRGACRSAAGCRRRRSRRRRAAPRSSRGSARSRARSRRPARGRRRGSPPRRSRPPPAAPRAARR